MVDLPRYRPDLIAMRHVLEHFEQPAAFIEELACAAADLEKVGIPRSTLKSFGKHGLLSRQSLLKAFPCRV